MHRSIVVNYRPLTVAADAIVFEPPPPGWQDRVKAPSASYAHYLWHGLALKTRTAYKSATASWEYFCKDRGLPPYPATHFMLELRLLGRWTSATCRLYFTTPQAEIFRLNARFQTGRSPGFSLLHTGINQPTIGGTGRTNGNLPGQELLQPSEVLPDSDSAN